MNPYLETRIRELERINHENQVCLLNDIPQILVQRLERVAFKESDYSRNNLQKEYATKEIISRRISNHLNIYDRKETITLKPKRPLSAAIKSEKAPINEKKRPKSAIMKGSMQPPFKV